MKGVNLSIKWGLTTIRVITDSDTVAGCIRIISLSGEKMMKAKGAADLLVKRRLGVIRDLICISKKLVLNVFLLVIIRQTKL